MTQRANNNDDGVRAHSPDCPDTGDVGRRGLIRYEWGPACTVAGDLPKPTRWSLA